MHTIFVIALSHCKIIGVKVNFRWESMTFKGGECDNAGTEYPGK